MGISVLGDAILDIYLEVRHRTHDDAIPGEAYEIVRERRCPGGAANVAAHLSKGGELVELFTAIGGSPIGRALQDCVVAAGVQLLTEGHEFPTWTDPCLTRVRDLGQTLIPHRIDVVGGWSDGDCALLSPLLPAFDVLVVADYGRLLVGPSVDELIRRSISSASLSVIDPSRAKEWSRFDGADYLKLNEREFLGRMGLVDEDMFAAAVDYAVLHQHAGLIITRGANGAAMVTSGGEVVHVPIGQGAVANPSGGGDAVMAGFAMGMMSGLGPASALRVGVDLAAEAVASECTCPGPTCVREIRYLSDD